MLKYFPYGNRIYKKLTLTVFGFHHTPVFYFFPGILLYNSMILTRSHIEPKNYDYLF